MQADGQIYFDNEDQVSVEDVQRFRDALAAEKEAATEAHQAAVAAIEEEAFARALLERLG